MKQQAEHMHTRQRPVYLNLMQIRLPIMGMVSLAHRASGVLLFLVIPYAVYLLGLSLASRAGFNHVMLQLQQPWLRFVLMTVLWALAHHLFAGIRFLLIDADLGVKKSSARLSAWLVIAAEAVVVVAMIWSFWR